MDTSARDFRGWMKGIHQPFASPIQCGMLFKPLMHPRELMVNEMADSAKLLFNCGLCSARCPEMVEEVAEPHMDSDSMVATRHRPRGIARRPEN